MHIGRCAAACNTDTTPTQPHRNTNTHWTKNNTINVVIQQNSRKLLMMDILMSETCWAHKKWNKIASDIKLVFYFSTPGLTRLHFTLSYVICYVISYRIYKNNNVKLLILISPFGCLFLELFTEVTKEILFIACSFYSYVFSLLASHRFSHRHKITCCK